MHLCNVIKCREQYTLHQFFIFINFVAVCYIVDYYSSSLCCCLFPRSNLNRLIKFLEANISDLQNKYLNNN